MTISVSAPAVTTPSQVTTPSATKIALNAFQQMVYRDDLNDVFFNDEDFAISISYYHSHLELWQIYKVISDDIGTSVDLLNGHDFRTTDPQFQVSSSALKHKILRGDYCLVGGKKYFVRDYEDDGVGVTTIYLRLK